MALFTLANVFGVTLKAIGALDNYLGVLSWLAALLVF